MYWGVEQVLSQLDMIQAEHLASIISCTSMDEEITVQVGEEELNLPNLDNMLLEALEDVPIQGQDNRIHVPAEHFFSFFAQVNVIRNRKCRSDHRSDFPTGSNAMGVNRKQFRLSNTLPFLLPTERVRLQLFMLE
jgi:hypothetical protein